MNKLNYSDLEKDNLYDSIDELLNQARSQFNQLNQLNQFKKINLMENDENIIAKIIIKCCKQNPYPTEILNIYHILIEFKPYATIGYVEIMNVFFSHVSKNIDIEFFVNDFENFILDDDVKKADGFNAETIEYCIANIKNNPLLYAKLFRIIHKCYITNVSKKSKYNRFIYNFFGECMTVEYAEVMISVCNPTLLLDYMEKHFDGLYIGLHKLEDLDHTLFSTFKFLVENNVEIYRSKKITTFFLKFSYKYNLVNFFEYLLTLGCRPDKKNILKHECLKIMTDHCLDIDDIMNIIN